MQELSVLHYHIGPTLSPRENKMKSKISNCDGYILCVNLARLWYPVWSNTSQDVLMKVFYSWD